MDAALDYAGVANAITFSQTPDLGSGTRATFVIPIIDFTRTFVGASRDEVEDQIEEFLKTEGADVYRRFLEAMNRSSPFAVSDGNPTSTTAYGERYFRKAGFR